MSSLSNFILFDLPRRIIERGIGTCVLVSASYFFLPEEIFKQVIIPLAIIEFYIGFLLPTIQVIGVAGNGNQLNRFAFFFLLFGPSVGAIVLFSVHWPSTILAIFVVFLSPMLLEAKIEVEKTDINKSIRIDTIGPLIAAFLTAFVYAAFYYFKELSYLNTPLIRAFFLLTVQASLLGIPRFNVSFQRSFFNLKGVISSLAGVEYSFIVMGLRVAVLNSISVLPEGAMLVKFIVLAYDPIASIYGMLIRFFHFQANFDGWLYVKQSSLFFLAQILIIFVLLFFSLIFSASFATISFVVLCLLFFASLTTHYIHASTVQKVLVISSVIVCICGIYVLSDRFLLFFLFVFVILLFSLLRFNLAKH